MTLPPSPIAAEPGEPGQPVTEAEADAALALLMKYVGGSYEWGQPPITVAVIPIAEALDIAETIASLRGRRDHRPAEGASGGPTDPVQAAADRGDYTGATALMQSAVCGVLSPCGRHGELLGCGFPVAHEPRDHSWATLPTFTEGRTECEVALEAATVRALQRVADVPINPERLGAATGAAEPVAGEAGE